MITPVLWHIVEGVNPCGTAQGQLGTGWKRKVSDALQYRYLKTPFVLVSMFVCKSKCVCEVRL